MYRENYLLRIRILLQIPALTENMTETRSRRVLRMAIVSVSFQQGILAGIESYLFFSFLFLSSTPHSRSGACAVYGESTYD